MQKCQSWSTVKAHLLFRFNFCCILSAFCQFWVEAESVRHSWAEAEWVRVQGQGRKNCLELSQFIGVWMLLSLSHVWVVELARCRWLTVRWLRLLGLSHYLTEMMMMMMMCHWQGNTALHYAVSQCNIGIMQTLLDTGVCDVRRQNRAGYTAIMLASLLIIDADVHRDVIRRLFIVGDVNVKSATVWLPHCFLHFVSKNSLRYRVVLEWILTILTNFDKVAAYSRK